jgi:hypothetical protein
MMNTDEWFYTVRPHRSIKIFRHCFATILVCVAAEVVYGLNPRISALFHYFSELPGNWLRALEFPERAVLRNFFVDISYEEASFPRDRGSDLFPNAYVVYWASGQKSPSRVSFPRIAKYLKGVSGKAPALSQPVRR